MKKLGDGCCVLRFYPVLYVITGGGLLKNGRHYGFDELNLVIVGLALLASFLFRPYGLIVSALLLGWALFRALSTKMEKRASELLWMKNHLRGLKSTLIGTGYRLRLWFRNLLGKIRYHRQYKTFKCKTCGQKLRVPRGKGKIRVTCRNCHTQFSMKS